MALSLVPSAFAADGDAFTVSFDNTAPKPGDTIVATMYLNRDMSDVYRLWSSIYYDKNVLSCKKVEYVGTEIANEITENTGEYESEVRFDENGRSDDTVAQKIQSLPQGEFARITFEVSSACNTGDAVSYRVKGGLYAKTGRKPLVKWESDFTLTVGTSSDPRTETGYSVSMAADQQAAAGDKVSIPVTVASDKVTGFNAYDMTFTYDPAALTLNTKTDDAANLTVKDDNGTVRVRRYGDAVPLGEALALDFTAKKAGTSTVTLKTAKFDIDANSINFDAPEATITDPDTNVKALWNVSLPDGFLSTAANGSTLVEDGKDFTFRATNTHYEYVLKINSNLVEMKTAEYTIKNVTANQNVEFVAKNGKTYTIKFEVEDNTTTENQATVADLVEYTGTTVQYPNDYKFTVKFPGTGYVVYPSVAPRQNTWDYVRREDGAKLYTLSGASLVGDDNNEITITLAKSKNNSLHNIVVTGSGADAFSESNALTFYSDENYTFALNKSDYYDYTIAVWYEKPSSSGFGSTPVPMEYKDNGDGTYTIINMPTYDVTIRITKTAKTIDPDTVEVRKYLELNNKTVFMVRVLGSLSAYNNIDKTTSYIGFTYDGQRMYVPFYGGIYNGNAPAYKANDGMSYSVYLVLLNKGETLTTEDAVAKLGVVTSTEQENKDQVLSVGSDVNEDGIGGVGIDRRDVNDVQLIYDLYNGLYDSFETVSMRKFLKADVNGDCSLDSKDAVRLAGQVIAG